MKSDMADPPPYYLTLYMVSSSLELYLCTQFQTTHDIQETFEQIWWIKETEDCYGIYKLHSEILWLIKDILNLPPIALAPSNVSAVEY